MKKAQEMQTHMQKAQKEVDLAKSALAGFDDSDHKVKLIELADFAISRLI